MLLWIVAIILALAIVFCRYPNAGLVLLIASLPFERLGVISLSPAGQQVRLAQLIGAALIAAVFLRFLLKQQPVRYLPITRWLLALGIWALVPVALINFGPLWQDYLSFLFVILLCYSVAQLINKHSLQLVATVSMATAVLVGLFGIYQFAGDSLGWSSSVTGLREAYSSTKFGFARIHGPAAEPLFYANWLLFPLLLSLGVLLTKKAKGLWLAGSCFGLSAVNLILTTSRGGYLAALVGGGVLVALLHFGKLIAGKRLKLLFLAAGLVLIVGLAGISLASWRAHGSFTTAPRLFISQTLSFGSSASYSERQQALDTGVELIKQQPLTGIGIGGVGYRLNNYPADADARERIAINNQFVETAVEIGVIGLLIFIGFLAVLLKGGLGATKASNKQTQVFAAVFTSLLLAVLVQLLTFSGFFITYLWVVFGILAGLGSLNPAFKSTRSRSRMQR